MIRFHEKALFLLFAAFLLTEQVCAAESVSHDAESAQDSMVASNSALMVQTTGRHEIEDQESSAVSESGADALLTVSTANLPAAAGVCSVVDAFVQQFCLANPNDISCQFQ